MTSLRVARAVAKSNGQFRAGFDARDGEKWIGSFFVTLDEMLALSTFGSTDKVPQLFNEWAAFRCSQLLEFGIAFDDERVHLTVIDKVLATELKAFAKANKSCDALAEEKRAAVCEVGTPDPKGTSHRLSTTRFQCSECWLPDERWLCSAVTNSVVRETLAFPGGAASQSMRHLSSQCSLGHEEVESSGIKRCIPGGHECWHRNQAPERPQEHDSNDVPTFHDALDALLAVLATVLGQSLERRINAGSIVRTTQPVSTKTELLSALNALKDILDGISLPDSVVPTANQSDKSMGRLKAAIDAVRPGNQQALAAIKVLQGCGRLRNSLEHTDAAAKLPGSLRDLNIRTGLTDWSGIWAAALSKARVALAELAEAIR